MILKLKTTDPKTILVELFENSKKIDALSKNQGGSQVLLPLINQILKKHKQSLRSSSKQVSTTGLNKKLVDVTSIEVDTGPGSFTGTRVGVAVANALGFALNIPVNGSPREVGKTGKIALPKYAKSKFDK